MYYRTMPVIVLDTCSMRRGNFSLKQFLSINETFCDEEIRLVVPEVVVWEWAEHAHDRICSSVQKAKEFHVDKGLYIVEEFPPVPTVEKLVGKITDLVTDPEGSEICKISGSHAVAAVKAQVLQTRCGERKKGVKTGAADELVLRCIEEFKQNDVVIAYTSDVHLSKVCKAIGVPSARSVEGLANELWEHADLDSFKESSWDVIYDLVSEDESLLSQSMKKLDAGFRIGSELRWWDEHIEPDIRIDEVSFGDFGEVTGKSNNGGLKCLVNVGVEANITLTLVDTIHPDWPAVGEPVQMVDSIYAGPAVIRYPILVTAKQGSESDLFEPDSFDVAGEAEVEFDREDMEWEDGYEDGLPRRWTGY